MADEAMGIGEAGLNILCLQPRIPMKDRVRRVARSIVDPNFWTAV
jgi:hypothetical protein